MTQFEFDQLSVMAGGWELRASTTDDEGERRILKSNADELRSFLRLADTSPGVEIDGEPAELPNMRHRPLPTIEET